MNLFSFIFNKKNQIDLGSIHDATLRVLEKCGMRIFTPELRKSLKKEEHM